MNKELVDDAIKSLELEQDEVDAAFWLENEVEVLEYLLIKALYRTEYGIKKKDSGNCVPVSSIDVANTIAKHGFSVPVYRNINRHTSKRGDWMEFTGR